jgi:polysaccharide pyruvyl transferase WcaK-like protein
VKSYFKKNIYLVDDLVWLFDASKYGKKDKNNKILTITWKKTELQGEKVRNKNNLMQAVVIFCKKNNINNISVLVVSDKDDLLESETFYVNLKCIASKIDENLEIKIIKNVTYDEKIKNIKNSDFVISSRLHPFMISKLFGKNSVVVNCTNKVESFLKFFDKKSEIRIKEDELAVKDYLDIFEKELSQKSCLVAGVEKHSQNAYRNFDLLNDFINNSIFINDSNDFK